MTETVISKMEKVEKKSNSIQKSYDRVYDAIEQNDKLIKNKIKAIGKIKKNTIGEFVYSNKNIPIQWKNKLDFQSNVAKILVEDQDLLYYLGKKSKQENKEKELSNIKQNNRIIRPKTAKTNSEYKNIRKLHLANRTRISSANTSLIFSYSKNKFKNITKKNKNLSKDEILDIFDDLQNKYPIKNKFSELYPNYEEEIQKHNKILKQNDEDNKKMDKIKNAFLTKNSGKSLHKKLKTFSDNIYNNLISVSKTNNKGKTSNSLINNNLSNKINKDPNSKIKIKNPVIFKFLKGLNFYGPYYSYCDPCVERNVDYYNRLEYNQCINLLKSIKKEKNKSLKISKITI